jgi:hypothetical protein
MMNFVKDKNGNNFSKCKRLGKLSSSRTIFSVYRDSSSLFVDRRNSFHRCLLSVTIVISAVCHHYHCHNYHQSHKSVTSRSHTGYSHKSHSSLTVTQYSHSQTDTRKMCTVTQSHTVTLSRSYSSFSVLWSDAALWSDRKS